MLFNWFVMTALASIVGLLAFVLSQKTFQDRNKLSPFECGFSSKDSARLPFSMRFFLITLLFLIFDVELVLLFPFFINIQYFTPLIFSILLTFIVALTGGLYFEWGNGMLEWNEY